MHTNEYKISYVCTVGSKGRVHEEHEPLTYEHIWKTCSDHLSTGSKGRVHQEHEPLNDEQMKNTWTYHLSMQALLYMK
jgi:hypothetical protein